MEPKESKQDAIKWSRIHRRIELCMKHEGEIRRFEINLYNLIASLIHVVEIISVFPSYQACHCNLQQHTQIQTSMRTNILCKCVWFQLLGRSRHTDFHRRFPSSNDLEIRIVAEVAS
jgi:hypothetical protein